MAVRNAQLWINLSWRISAGPNFYWETQSEHLLCKSFEKQQNNEKNIVDSKKYETSRKSEDLPNDHKKCKREESLPKCTQYDQVWLQSYSIWGLECWSLFSRRSPLNVVWQWRLNEPNSSTLDICRFKE